MFRVDTWRHLGTFVVDKSVVDSSWIILWGRMELDNLVHRCLLFSKSTVTNERFPSTNAIKTECPFTYDTVRYRQSKGGIRVGKITYGVSKKFRSILLTRMQFCPVLSIKFANADYFLFTSVFELTWLQSLCLVFILLTICDNTIVIITYLLPCLFPIFFDFNFGASPQAIGSASQRSNLYYDEVSKNLIIKKVQNHIGQKLDKLYDKLKILKISGAFHLWRERSLKSTICRRIRPNSEYEVKVTVANTLWSTHMIKSKKNSLGIILGLFSDHLNKTTKRRFLFWKRYARKSKYMMIRYFDKWSVKVSRIILNKMNIIRFMEILNDKINKLDKIKMKNYFIKFRKRVDYINMMEKLKSKLESWRIFTHAMATGRRSRKKYYLEIWKEYLNLQRIERKVKFVIFKINHEILQAWNPKVCFKYHTV